MTPDELDAIEKAHRNDSPYDRHMINNDVPALIAALREAWERRDAWRDTATTLRGLLDNHAHNDQAMNDDLLAVTAERDEARAAIARVRAVCDRAWEGLVSAAALRAAIEDAQ